MSVKLTIIEQMEQIAREHGKILAPLKEDLVLADCGLELARLRRSGRASGRPVGHRSVLGRRGSGLSGHARRFREGLRAWRGVDAPSLREIVAKEGTPRSFYDRGAALRFTDLARGTSFGDRLRELAGRSVLLATESQLTSALALIELEGVARRIVILPPDADPAHLPAIIAIAGIDAVLTDEGAPTHTAFDRLTRVVCRPVIEPLADDLPPRSHTEWIMMTSGTTGVPKMVIHDLATLTTALRVPSPADGAGVWGTFYDIRRYGGLQIYLRAVCGGASLVLSSAGEPVPDHLARLGAPWRDASVRHALAMAPRADDDAGERSDRAALCAPLRRDRRSGGARQSARGVSRRDHRACLCLDRSRRRVRRQRRPGRLSHRIYRHRAQRRRHENSRRHAAHPLVAERRKVTSGASRCSMPRASSIPATSSSGMASGFISPAARAASSISAA